MNEISKKLDKLEAAEGTTNENPVHEMEGDQESSHEEFVNEESSKYKRLRDNDDEESTDEDSDRPNKRLRDIAEASTQTPAEVSTQTPAEASTQTTSDASTQTPIEYVHELEQELPMDIFPGDD